MKTEWVKVKNLSVGSRIAVCERSAARLVSSSSERAEIAPGFDVRSQGDRVATSVGTAAKSEGNLGSGALLWDEIVSIKSVGRERVYDIEVENSHNFVGNGILAHNTYIFGNLGIGTTSPSHKLEVSGDIASTGFVNLSTREAKKGIEYLTTADYEQVLSKISNEVKPASYYYNSDTECNNSVIPGLTRDPGLDSGSSAGMTSGACSKRLGLIAQEAPLEVLSADGKGIDLYKLATFTLMGVKALDKEVKLLKSDFNSLESRVATLEQAVASGALAVQTNFNQALTTIGGEAIQLSPGSIADLANNLYASVISGLRQMGLAVEQGIVRAQKLIANILQADKLVVNTLPQTNALGETKDATIGSSQINVGELNAYIMNNQVSATTKIFVTPESSQPVSFTICEKHFQPEYVGSVERPQGFRICMSATTTEVVKFSWWIVETVSEISNDKFPMTNQTPSPNVQTINAPVVSASPQPSPDASSTSLGTSTPTPISSPTPTETLAPTPTPQPSPEASPSLSPSLSPDVSLEPSPSPTPTPSPSATPSASPEPI